MPAGTLKVSFVANYVGDHRVCWRVGTTGAYNCSTVVTCAGLGATCEANILIDFSLFDEQCTDTIIEGYVQATCNPEASLTGRVPFSTLYTPEWPCAFWTATRDAGINDNLAFGLDCSGTDINITSSVVGETYNKCGSPTVTPVSENWTIVKDNAKCCYDCKSVQFNSTGGATYTFSYIDCATLETIIETNNSEAQPVVTRCIVNYSESLIDKTAATYLGDC